MDFIIWIINGWSERRFIMTNADRIRNMSDEELASWYVIKCEIMMGIKYQKPYKTCKDCILDWLQSEAE